MKPTKKAKRLKILDARAERLSRKGLSGEMIRICREILSLDPNAVNALRCVAIWHLEREEFLDALPFLLRLYEAGSEIEGLLLPLTVALEAAGDFARALDVARELVGQDNESYLPYLYLGSVLQSMGREEEATRTYGIAAHLNPLLRQLLASPETPQFARKRVEQCLACLEQFGRALHADAVEKARVIIPDADTSRVAQGYWRKLHDGPEDTHSNQHAHVFYVPKLDRSAWFEREEFDWVERLENETSNILEELMANYRGDADTTPYLKEAVWDPTQWGGLVMSKRWAAFHFYDGAQRLHSNCERFPHTMSVLDDLPLFTIRGTPVEALLSVLKPKTHIPPHHGTSNTRLTVHLPLLVPDNCSLTVNDEERRVQRGRVMLFDDSFIHEARNDSDELRIVLIFEVWHPDLTAVERLAIEESHALYVHWVNDASIREAINRG